LQQGGAERRTISLRPLEFRRAAVHPCLERDRTTTSPVNRSRCFPSVEAKPNKATRKDRQALLTRRKVGPEPRRLLTRSSDVSGAFACADSTSGAAANLQFQSSATFHSSA